jgi:hypothetical protein
MGPFSEKKQNKKKQQKPLNIFSEKYSKPMHNG